MIIDTHAHYGDEQFDKDRKELLNSMIDNGIEKIVEVGADMDTSRDVIRLLKEYPFLYGAVGVHPSSTKKMTDEDIFELKRLSKNERVVAIGEIGLDYYYEQPDKEVQKRWFVKQLELAREVKLPVIIHSRDAASDTLAIMKEQKAEDIGGVIHCFSYPIEIAKEYLDMGFYLGVGGIVTFKNARKLVEVVEYAPITAIVLETDCPYLSPEPNRGQRNSSRNLSYVVQKIAQIKGMEEEEVIRITTENAKKLYRL